jgi:hypothetical protein
MEFCHFCLFPVITYDYLQKMFFIAGLSPLWNWRDGLEVEDILMQYGLRDQMASFFLGKRGRFYF